MTSEPGLTSIALSYWRRYVKYLGIDLVATSLYVWPAAAIAVAFGLDTLVYVAMALVGFLLFHTATLVSSGEDLESEGQEFDSELEKWVYHVLGGVEYTTMMLLAALGTGLVTEQLGLSTYHLALAFYYPIVELEVGRLQWWLAPSIVVKFVAFYVVVAVVELFRVALRATVHVTSLHPRTSGVGRGVLNSLPRLSQPPRGTIPPWTRSGPPARVQRRIQRGA